MTFTADEQPAFRHSPLGKLLSWFAILSAPFWAWIWAALVGLSASGTVRSVSILLPVIVVGLAALFTMRYVGFARGVRVGPIQAVRAWLAAEKSSRPIALLLSLPLGLSLAGVGLIQLPESTRGISAVSFGLAAAFAAIGGIFAGREAVRSAENAFAEGDTMARRIAAVLGISPETLAYHFRGDAAGRITIRPVPQQAVGHFAGLEAGLALHMGDYEVQSATVDQIVLAPVTAETSRRRALAEQSGGLITGLGDAGRVPDADPRLDSIKTIDLTDL